MTQADPFDDIVDATGLSKIIARGIVERALAVVGTSIQAATEADYVRAMPVLRGRLAAFVDVDALHRLDALALRLRARAQSGPWQPTLAGAPSESPATARPELTRVIRGTRGPHRYESYVLEHAAVF